MTRSGRFVAGLSIVIVVSHHIAASPGSQPIRQVFSFQIGGSGNHAVALAVDPQGNSYAVGSRYIAQSFPVTERAVEKNPRAMFVAKVDSRGEKLVWATYLGGSHNRNGYWRGPLDYPVGVAVDPQGNVLVVGWTASDDYPAVNAAVGSPGGSGSEGVLTKISSDGASYLYSTYLGGGHATAIATDFIGSAYLALSADTRLPYETHDLTSPGVSGGAVIAKFNPAGQPVFATRFGGTTTTVSRIAVDRTGAIVVAGTSDADRFPLVRPITSNCWPARPGSCSNPYVARFDPGGTRILFSTFVGGISQSSAITSLALDPGGAVYVAGTTKATDFPVRRAFQSSNAGATDCFLMKIAADDNLETSTYVGSDSDDLSATSSPAVLVDLLGRPTLAAATTSRVGIVPGMEHPDAPVYISKDDGASWSASATGLRTGVYVVAVSERDRTWYAGAVDGVWRSVDGGSTWSRSNAGIAPDFSGNLDTSEIAVDPAHAGTIYAGTVNGTYQSQNRGDTWTRIDAQPFRRSFGQQAQLVVDGNGWVFLGTEGVRRSQDGGRTWLDISQGLERNGVGTKPDHYQPADWIGFDPAAAGIMYVIQSEHLYRSVNGGNDWTVVDVKYPVDYPPGYAVTSVYGAGIPAGRRRRLFASGWNELLRSDDGGTVWNTLAGRLHTAGFAIDSRRSDTVFAFDSWSGSTSGLVSNDGGDTWRPLRLPTASKTGVIVDPLRIGTLFAPGGIRTLPLFVQFDDAVARVRYASFVDAEVPTAIATDPFGAFYVLPSATDRFTITKLQPPQILNPSRSGSR
jgi:photosystem II stability/assembly factor-like uncharacterized protein